MVSESPHIVFRSGRRVGECMRIVFEGVQGGQGVLDVRDAFAGVRLIRIDAQGIAGESMEGLPQMWGDWSLLSCQKGQMRCFMEGAEGMLGEGRAALLVSQGRAVVVSAPQGQMRVLVLAVSEKDLPKDASFMMRNYFGIDPEQPVGPLSSAPLFSQLPANLEAAHVFSELYAELAVLDQARLRLKCLELMALHGNAALGVQGDARPSSIGMPQSASHRDIAFRAQQAMIADLGRTHAIEQLAQACGTSPTVLKQAFRESFGMPVYTWFRNYRVLRACELMEQEPDRRIASIAAEVGYANPSKFAKAFADCMGTSPREWRSQHARPGPGQFA